VLAKKDAVDEQYSSVLLGWDTLAGGIAARTILSGF